PVHWTRFYRALQFHLRPTEEGATGTAGAGLIDFYHAQLRQAVFRRYLAMGAPEAGPSPAYRAAHRRLARYFEEQARDGGVPLGWRVDRPRALGELPYHLTLAGEGAELEGALTDLPFLEAKCQAGLTYELVADFGRLGVGRGQPGPT